MGRKQAENPGLTCPKGSHRATEEGEVRGLVLSEEGTMLRMWLFGLLGNELPHYMVCEQTQE